MTSLIGRNKVHKPCILVYIHIQGTRIIIHVRCMYIHSLIVHMYISMAGIACGKRTQAKLTIGRIHTVHACTYMYITYTYMYTMHVYTCT